MDFPQQLEACVKQANQALKYKKEKITQLETEEINNGKEKNYSGL